MNSASVRFPCEQAAEAVVMAIGQAVGLTPTDSQTLINGLRAECPWLKLLDGSNPTFDADTRILSFGVPEDWMVSITLLPQEEPQAVSETAAAPVASDEGDVQSDEAVGEPLGEGEVAQVTVLAPPPALSVSVQLELGFLNVTLEGPARRAALALRLKLISALMLSLPDCASDKEFDALQALFATFAQEQRRSILQSGSKQPD